jgi:Predicted ATPase
MNEKIDTSIKDIFSAIDRSNMHLPTDISVPNNFYQQLLDYFLERGYLNTLPERNKFVDFRASGSTDRRDITWLKVMRLPIHPNELKEYDLLSRWQSVLSTLHTWGHRLIFLLQRRNGETNIYLGTTALSRSSNAKQALEQFKEAAMSGMPGIDLHPLLTPKEQMEFAGNLWDNTSIGTVTGIPSLRQNSQFGILQTLDQLSFGIRDINGDERDYSLMVIADPVCDQEISRTISNFRKLGSEIHLDVMRSVNEGENISESKGSNLGIGAIIGSLGAIMHIPLLSMMNSVFSKSITKSAGSSKSVMTQYLDKFAQYAEQITDKHCARLNKGRNLGFWNAGIYVLGKSNKDINTVMGMLRAIYSGDESFVEPIRVHILNEKSGALDIVRRCDLIPLISDKLSQEEQKEDWNILGSMYQYVSTPLNTEELSIATSLPRRDVPGLRFVKTSVRFANNPAQVDGDTICLGKVVDTGVVQNNEYRIDPNALVRHAIVAGSTGSGKSTTCKTIIKEILNRNIPVLIIEPAKDDYIRWAISYNQKIDADSSLSDEEKESKKFQLYMPGVDSLDGVRINRLKLNPFQPAAIKDAPIDMMTRCEQVTALFNASLPTSDVLPVLIDESLYRFVYEQVGEQFLNGDMPQLKDYPRLDGVIDAARRVLAARGYDKKVQDDIRAALETRFTYLTRGKRGNILNVNSSTDYDRLFSHPTVINVSRIANSKDKALIMSILTLALYEYRISAYTYDAEYRSKAQQNKLLHLTVIEEAHNLLLKPSVDTSNSGNPQQVVADLFSNMLSEIRSYGQGMMIVDQIPTRLVADAIKNTNYKIVHRLTAPDDCAAMAAGLALRDDQEKVIPALSVGDAIICGDLDDAAAWVRLNNPNK